MLVNFAAARPVNKKKKRKKEVNAEDLTARCSACMSKQRTTEWKKTLTASLTIQDEQNRTMFPFFLLHNMF